ncbi:MAG: hypothetical protein JO027_00670 [Solirubrobacterales bacterium]|nr:hypothetical protein [Solirubrobacterales bacterium]
MTPPDSIERLCGAHIDAISVEEHVAGTQRSLLSIYLQLHNRSSLRIRGGPGGWGLSVGSDPPRAYDMEQYGRVEIRPADRILARAVGQAATVWTAHSPEDATPVGFRWRNSTGTDIVVYCYDDTLLVAPPDELELDDVTYSEIC